MHSENYQTSKIELSLGNRQRLNSTSRFCIKLPLRCLTEPQVRKIGGNTDNKEISKLTSETHSEIGEASETEILTKQPTVEIC